MITDVLYGVNMYIAFCGKCFELSHVMDIALQKCYVLLLLCFIISDQGPIALSNLLHPYTRSWRLRSSVSRRRVFRITTLRTRPCGQRSFSNQAPSIPGPNSLLCLHLLLTLLSNFARICLLLLLLWWGGGTNILFSFIVLRARVCVRMFSCSCSCACVRACVRA